MSLLRLVSGGERWRFVERPGYFGRRRDEKVSDFNARFGVGGWRLIWVVGGDAFDFRPACTELYEESYFRYLKDRPSDVDFICSFHDCYDNAPSNIRSGTDYEKQESWATHIQDIAVRNALRRLGRWFALNEGEPVRLLQIRSRDSDGYRFGPGNVPFFVPAVITQPSLAPAWANRGSVEDMWQSNKWLCVRS